MVSNTPMVKTTTPHLHRGTQLDCGRIREVGIGVTGLLGVHVRESSSEETVSFTEFTQWFDAQNLAEEREREKRHAAPHCVGDRRDR